MHFIWPFWLWLSDVEATKLGISNSISYLPLFPRHYCTHIIKLSSCEDWSESISRRLCWITSQAKCINWLKVVGDCFKKGEKSCCLLPRTFTSHRPSFWRGQQAKAQNALSGWSLSWTTLPTHHTTLCEPKQLHHTNLHSCDQFAHCSSERLSNRGVQTPVWSCESGLRWILAH